MVRVRRHGAAALVVAVLAGAWFFLAGQGGSAIVPIPNGQIVHYVDGRPAARLRLAGVKDQGVVLAHGDGPGKSDIYGARDVSVFRSGGAYYMHYDASGPAGWISNLATSQDLRHWQKRGPIFALGPPGSSDSASASYATTFRDGDTWHAFYLGTPHATPPPDRVPQFPYLTLHAVSRAPAGPWRKTGAVPFSAVAGTYYSVTASPGQIVRGPDGPLQFFSAAQLQGQTTLRTIGIARTHDLNGPWTVDPTPILPPTEQVENASLYHQAATGTWFLFTNHVGIDPARGEFTDAIWVYWTQDPTRWNPAHKALVLDGHTSTWSHAVIGLPSVVAVNRHRLAVFYDGRSGPAASELLIHMDRDIGVAFVKLPIRVPVD